MQPQTQAQVIKAAQIVNLIKAKQRIPAELRERKLGFFGAQTYWHYFDTMNDANECEYCRGYHGLDFAGSDLRLTFPNLEVVDENTIYPHVHASLGWTTEADDTCKCVLVRVNVEEENWDPSKRVMYNPELYKPETRTTVERLEENLNIEL